MKTIKHLLAFAAFVSALSSLHADTKSIGYFESIEKEAAPVVGEQYYMRHCLRYEAGKEWETTNYWTDSSIFVPINSKVTLNSLGSHSMQIKIEKSGQVLTIENVQKYSQREMAEIAKNMLTRTPVPIEKFDEKVAKNIRNGILTLGMTKEQVIMTRGYPPGHKTPSLEIDSWTYWNNRFGTHLLVFQDGVLAKGRGLY
ncbi:MAG: hypothetical protein QM715_12210 [Nibricoccus sp.]